jgi:hypothetical protein
VVAIADGRDLAPLRRDFDAVNDVLAERTGSRAASRPRLPLDEHGARARRWAAVPLSLRVARASLGAAERLYVLDPHSTPSNLQELDRLVASWRSGHATSLPVGACCSPGAQVRGRDPRRVTAALLAAT